MEDLYVSPQLTILVEELDVSFIRSSGPGGQNVNKVNSKVRLSWDIVGNKQIPKPWKDRVLATFPTRITTDGRITVISQLYRDQGRNLENARDKLRDLLLSCQYPPKTRRPSKPSRSSKLRRLEGKRREGEKKRLRKPPETS